MNTNPPAAENGIVQGGLSMLTLFYSQRRTCWQ